MSQIKLASLLTVLAATMLNSAGAQENKLGLAERRAIKAYQDEKLPALQKSINEAAKMDIELDVKWETIAKPGQAEKYLADDDYWTNIYFTPLISALKSIAADDMGKEALKKTLKKVVIYHDENTAPASNYANGLKFEQGALIINFTPWTNAVDLPARSEAIQKFLESKL
jgi:hypothetical protein